MATVGIQHIIAETGGFGRFQISIMFIVHSMKCIATFSIVHMVFGGKEPDWWCLDGISLDNHTDTSAMNQSSSDTFKACNLHNLTCSNVQFDDTISTIISEWALVCSNDWVPTTITSIQMAGVFAGNVISGQLADLIGRKPPLFSAVLSLVILNIVAAFSTSWVMFAVLRFFIGIACGVQFTVQYSIQSEFTEARWRSWVVAVPSWAIGMALFALASWLLKDWRHIHLVTAATGLPWLLTYWFVPESFRWYLSHNRKDDARRVIQKVARINRRNDFILNESDLMVEEGTDARDRKYTLIDLVRDGRMLKLSVLLLVNWITVGLGAYGIQFGVPKLSGDLYLNMFIVSLFGSPLQFLNIFLMNRFGRKPTAILFLVAFAATALVVGVAERLEESTVVQTVSSFSAIAALTAVNALWSPIQTLTIEVYPTVVRNIGYGVQNTMARVGAILGPQLLYLDTKISGLMYLTCAAIALLSVVTTVFLPETSSEDLGDTIKSRRTKKEITLEQKTVENHV